MTKIFVSVLTTVSIIIPSVGLGLTMDKTLLEQQALSSLAKQELEILEQEAKVKKLESDLEAVRDESGLVIFKTIRNTCGIVAAISVASFVVAAVKNKSQMATDSFVPGVISGGCTAAAGFVYSLINDDEEKADKLLEAAQLELEDLKNK